MRGDPLKPPWNYLLEGGPLSYRLPLLGECSRNPSVAVHQLALLWEATCSFNAYFWRLICPFHDGWFMSVPAHTVLSVQQFLTKNGMTLVPYPPYSPDLVLSDFFFVFPDGKSPQGVMFCWCGRDETKTGRSTKRQQNWWVQKLFWAVGNMSQ